MQQIKKEGAHYLPNSLMTITESTTQLLLIVIPNFESINNKLIIETLMYLLVNWLIRSTEKSLQH